MNQKSFLYFFLALLPSLLGTAQPPTTSWDWFKLIGQGIYQGLLALKALQSMPDPVTPTDLAQAKNSVTTQTGTFAGPIKLPLAIMLVSSFFFCSCGTPGGIAVANFLESPVNAQIIQVGVNAGMNSLMLSAGSKIPSSVQQPLTAAASTVATGVATSTIDYLAELLRTKQSTKTAGATGALTATLSSATSTETASAIATAVTTLTKQGIPPDQANEAVASTLNAVSAAHN